MVNIPMGNLQIGLALQILVQNQVPNMTSMVGRFLSLVHTITQNLAR